MSLRRISKTFSWSSMNDEDTANNGCDFRSRIYWLMAQLPADKVTTYGDLAAWAGSPRAARVVGGVAHFGHEELPWHRLVNAQGGLAVGFPGGVEVQQQLLEQEGIRCVHSHVDNFGERRWRR